MEPSALVRFKDSTILAALDTAWNAANNVTNGLVALAADVVGIAQHGVVYTGGTGKIAEHGDADPQDRNVPLVVSGASVEHHTKSSETVETTQIAPTILRLLGLNPNHLQGQRRQRTSGSSPASTAVHPGRQVAIDLEMRYEAENCCLAPMNVRIDLVTLKRGVPLFEIATSSTPAFARLMAIHSGRYAVTRVAARRWESESDDHHSESRSRSFFIPRVFHVRK
jgi:hypothetical protein